MTGALRAAEVAGASYPVCEVPGSCQAKPTCHAGVAPLPVERSQVLDDMDKSSQLFQLRDLLTLACNHDEEWERRVVELVERIAEASRDGSLIHWVCIQVLDSLSVSDFNLRHLAHAVTDVIMAERPSPSCVPMLPAGG